MPSTYLITNSDQVFVYPICSGLAFPGSTDSAPPQFKWFNARESLPLGPAGFLWDRGEKVKYYQVPVSGFQAELISAFLTPVKLTDAWEQTEGSLKNALQLVIDPKFFDSLENDLELYVLDRLKANNGLTVLQLAEEFSVQEKIALRGLERLADERNLVSFWSRERTYKITKEGSDKLLQHGWTPQNTSESFPVLPVSEQSLSGDKEDLVPTPVSKLHVAKTVHPSDLLASKPKSVDRDAVLKSLLANLALHSYMLFHNGAVVKNIRALCGISILKTHYMIACFAEEGKIPPLLVDKFFLGMKIGDSKIPVKKVLKALRSQRKPGLSDNALVDNAISTLDKPISNTYVFILLKHFRAAGAM